MSLLLFGAKLFTLTPNLLVKLKRYQSCFLINMFYVTMLVSGLPIKKMSGLKSIKSEIAIKLPMGSLFVSITKTFLTPILHHWVFCQVLQTHHINMIYLITWKIGTHRTDFVKFILM